MRGTMNKPGSLNPWLPPIDSFYFEDLQLMHRALRNDSAGLLAPFIAGVEERIDCTARDFVAPMYGAVCCSCMITNARIPIIAR